MSTPTGGPINPIDPFAHAAHEMHERAGAEQHAAESDHERIRSAYAPKKIRTPPAQRADVATREDITLVAPQRPDRLRERSEQYAVGADESNLSSRDPDLDSSLQPARPQNQHHEQPAAARHDADISDLRRLEATLRWIGREETAVRIPRAAQLPPVPGLTRTDVGGRPHGDESSEFRLPRSLEPERMAPPPSRSRRPRATRFAHFPDREHLGGVDRVLSLDRLLAPVLAPGARTANGFDRCQRRRDALVHRTAGAPEHGGPRQRSCHLGPTGDIFSASGDLTAAKLTRRRACGDVATKHNSRTGYALQ